MLERVLCPTLVGRDEQLFVLEDALLAAHRGESRFIALGGEAGMGKTRLATELTKRANRLGWVILWGACSEAELPLPYLPLVEALGNYLSLQDAEQLRGMLGAAGRELAQLFPQLGGNELAVPVGDPAQAKLRLFEAVVALLTLPAREHGLLVVVEDVHWADSATRELLDHLARRLTNMRSLVIVTYRSDELDRRHPFVPLLQTWRRSGVAELVALTPLERGEIAEMIAAILDDEEIGREFRDMMHARTEGNPFVLEEMLKDAIDRGDVFRTSRGWQRRSLEELRIPETVRDTILLRFARLDPAEAEVLQAAAVLGRTFGYATLVAVAGVPDSTVHGALAVGVAQQLLEEVGGGQATYRWRHALTQEAVADEIVLPRRQAIHSRAADVLAGTGAGSLQVARHLLGAARFDDAVPACVAAAEEAEASFAFAEALELLERALPHVRDPLGRSQLLCRMGRALWMDGNTSAAEVVLAVGVPGLEEAGEELEAARYRLVLGRCRWERSRPDLAREEFEQARRVLEDYGPSAELSVAYTRLAGLYKFEFDDARSLEAATKAVETARAAGADFERIWASSWVALVLFDAGRSAEATEMLDQSFEEARRRGYAFIAHNIAYNDAWTRLHTMTPGIRDRITAIESEPGPPVITDMIAIATSWAARANGDLLGALDAVERARETFAGTASEKVRWRTRVELAEVLLELGRLDEAAAILPSPSERAELQDIVYDSAPQIRLRMATGRLDEAVELAHEIAERAERLAPYRGTLAVAVEALVAAALLDEAQAVVDAGRAHAYPLDREPRAVAVGKRTGAGAVWVLGAGKRDYQVLRIDPATGKVTARTRLPASSRISSLEVGLGRVWVVSASTAVLYRIHPRSAAVTGRVDLGQRAGRPSVEFGIVYVVVSDPSGPSLVVDPRTLDIVMRQTCCPLGNGYDIDYGHGSEWMTDWKTGAVHRFAFAPTWGYVLEKVIAVTSPPGFYGGLCLTSLVAGAGAVWVTLASSTEPTCSR